MESVSPDPTPAPEERAASAYKCCCCGNVQHQADYCDPDRGGCGRKAGAGPEGTVLEPLLPASYWTGERIEDARAVDLLDEDSGHLTDMGNGARFALLHRDKALYCHAWKSWLVWDDSRWEPDPGGKAMALAKAVVRTMGHEALNMPEGEGRVKALSHALRSESDRALKATLHLAESELPIAPDQLDCEPHLLNTPNYTIDLHTGEGHPPRRNDHITKRTRGGFFPGSKMAEAPSWQRLLEDVTGGDQEYKAFLQRAVADTLLARGSRKNLFLVFGPTSTGKTTFLSALEHALGDYADVMVVEALLHHKRAGNVNDPELAKLHGVRFVQTSEVGRGSALNEARLKLITGGGRVTATAKYKDPFKYEARFTVWMDTNHLPTATGDPAVWERVIVLPFDAQIPEGERDLHLGEELEREASGILAWAVEKCPEVHRDGLGTVPEKCRMATQAYREESDPAQRWLEERCERGPDKVAPFGDLSTDYNEWCEREGIAGPDRMTDTALGGWFKEQGFGLKRTGKVRLRVGIALKDQLPIDGDAHD